MDKKFFKQLRKETLNEFRLAQNAHEEKVNLWERFKQLFQFPRFILVPAFAMLILIFIGSMYFYNPVSTDVEGYNQILTLTHPEEKILSQNEFADFWQEEDEADLLYFALMDGFDEYMDNNTKIEPALVFEINS